MKEPLAAVQVVALCVPYSGRTEQFKSIATLHQLCPNWSTNMLLVKLVRIWLFTCTRIHLLSHSTDRHAVNTPCGNSIKHASVDEVWADTCGVDSGEPLCMELCRQGLVGADCTKLGGTVVHQTIDTKQPCSRSYSYYVAMVLGFHRRKEGLDCLQIWKTNATGTLSFEY